MQDILEKILKDTLAYYLGLDDGGVVKHLNTPSLATKERITTIDDLQIIIYSNDHEPPHFHIKTKNGKIDARFTIKNCDLISGNISAKDLKKIEAFYKSPKGKIVLETIWNKRKHSL